MKCIFCEIINKNIPSSIVYEDEGVIAFLDINPRTRGHTLVVPKRHVSSLVELSDEEVCELFRDVKKCAELLMKKLGATGFNIGLNNGRSAGQLIEHVHVHVLPRYGDEGKGFESAFPIDEELGEKVRNMPKGLIDFSTLP
ncbi:HIT family protein [Methanosarcinales archaeon]|nr:MAG: HIT family protein [Methanosarcinales archaeon]